ncbi:hypothetical protein GWI33_022335 [Rhynchophorus ferrugineus]|uniref:Uncharacterized protein n=1 Tax=Rhynchophorus ferrugineus TaxID=354439 RepID=A0A834HU57_RHYFE|nr:hypothetical protein GWI33_022335 [Rhynchophorus ferrugineus]
MEIQNEIIKTRARIDHLHRQNETFRDLLEKAQSLGGKAEESDAIENEFTQESLSVIEKIKENLKCELKSLSSQSNISIEILLEKLQNLENISNAQDKEIECLKCEQAEIKFLLSHPEANRKQWLQDIINFQSRSERKKAELIIAIKNASIPENCNNIKTEIKQVTFEGTDHNSMMERYEDLRFQMLNLEDERFKLLQELQYILEDSRKQIAEEYNNLQKKIAAVEGGSVSLHQLSNERTSGGGHENVQTGRNMPEGDEFLPNWQFTKYLLSLHGKVETSNAIENEFTQESLSVIEKIKEYLKCELKFLSSQSNISIEILLEKLQNLENIRNVQDKETECEQAEIKFFLSHPEAHRKQWLQDIINFQSKSGKEHEITLERHRL